MKDPQVTVIQAHIILNALEATYGDVLRMLSPDCPGTPQQIREHEITLVQDLLDRHPTLRDKYPLCLTFALGKPR